MEHWVTNFGVQIGFEALTPPPLRRGFPKLNLLPPSVNRPQKHVSDHDSAPNYPMIKKLYMERLDLNTYNLFSAISKFSIQRDGKGGDVHGATTCKYL